MKKLTSKLFLLTLFFLALSNANCGGGSPSSSSQEQGNASFQVDSSSSLNPLIVSGAGDSADWTGYLTSKFDLHMNELPATGGPSVYQVTGDHFRKPLWKKTSFKNGALCTVDAISKASLDDYIINVLGFPAPPSVGTASSGMIDYLMTLIVDLQLSLQYQSSFGAYNTAMALDFLNYMQVQNDFVRLSESVQDTSAPIFAWDFTFPTFTAQELLKNPPPSNPYLAPWTLAFEPMVIDLPSSPKGPGGTQLGGGAGLGGGSISPPSPGGNPPPAVLGYVIIVACTPN